ncbi:PLD nuclease N-terminal domain-containing protein [Haloechinothrix halophila]|uniref:PLD nuclease N-terminal domain-containing protein n=1 Tax=Haloechinothrix halophila TaxID=1069073 RepID=UPI000423307C|nr:PLD nuclease N-terminal domain-containing protein [Haloechinothrix halophila]
MPVLGLGAVSLFLLALWLYCIYNVITTDESGCRNLPKVLWLVIVIFVPTVGSIMWLIAGRPVTARPARPVSGPTGFPEYDRPGRHIAANPAADEEFLRRCRERAEEQRKAAHERKENSDDSTDADGS